MLKQWTNEEGSTEIRSLVVIQVGFLEGNMPMIYLLKKKTQAPRFKASEDQQAGLTEMRIKCSSIFKLELADILEFLGLWIQNSVHFESAPTRFSMSLLFLLCNFAEGDVFRMHRCCYSRSACT